MNKINQENFRKKLTFTYKNYRGEVSLRHVFPIDIRYGSTEWHPEEQWLLKAWDYAKGEYREFAMSDIIEISSNRGDE